MKLQLRKEWMRKTADILHDEVDIDMGVKKERQTRTSKRAVIEPKKCSLWSVVGRLGLWPLQRIKPHQQEREK